MGGVEWGGVCVLGGECVCWGGGVCVCAGGVGGSGVGRVGGGGGGGGVSSNELSCLFVDVSRPYPLARPLTNISDEVLRSLSGVHKMLTIIVMRVCTLRPL